MIRVLNFQTEVTPDKGSVPSSIAGVDPNFKMPQVWKSALGIDYQLPVKFPFTVTVEGMFTKNINAVTQQNYAVKDPESSWAKFSGADNRYIYPSSVYHITNVRDACVLSNTNKGYGYTFNVTLQAQPVKDLNMMFAYTLTEFKEVSGNPGSNANSAWINIYSVNGPNTSGIQRSQNVTPHEIKGFISYRLPDLAYKGTSISLDYAGYSPYANSFLYANDMNGDGVNGDLIYIPSKRGDIKFVTQADEDAFFKFMEQDKYLSTHKGQYAEAYAARPGFVHRFNLAVIQDFNVRAGKTKNTLQLRLDILNVGNMLNTEWGVNKTMSASNNGRILRYEGKDANNTPSFSMVKVSGAYPTQTYIPYEHLSQCWGMKIGLRYIFN